MLPWDWRCCGYGSFRCQSLLEIVDSREWIPAREAKGGVESPGIFTVFLQWWGLNAGGCVLPIVSLDACRGLISYQGVLYIPQVAGKYAVGR